MKKIIFFFLLLIMSASGFSQQTNPSTTLTKQDYLQKSKKQKTAAWIMLGGGLAMFAIAAPGNVSLDVLGPIVVVGTFATLGSIPLFIASGKNKRKGMSLSFKNETAPQLLKRNFVYKHIPLLTLKINL